MIDLVHLHERVMCALDTCVCTFQGYDKNSPGREGRNALTILHREAYPALRGKAIIIPY